MMTVLDPFVHQHADCSYAIVDIPGPFVSRWGLINYTSKSAIAIAIASGCCF